MASQLAVLVAMYSTFVELSATEVCFLLNHDIIAEPQAKVVPRGALLVYCIAYPI
jgi:hypothetical protein